MNIGTNLQITIDIFEARLQVNVGPTDMDDRARLQVHNKVCVYGNCPVIWGEGIHSYPMYFGMGEEAYLFTTVQTGPRINTCSNFDPWFIFNLGKEKMHTVLYNVTHTAKGK
jgi:hypothetical protein